MGQAILPKLLRCIETMYSSNYHDASDDKLEPTFRQVPITRRHIPSHPQPAGCKFGTIRIISKTPDIDSKLAHPLL